MIAAVKAQSPATPVIAFTGTGERQADQVERLGAFCCLYKPLNDLDVLVSAIERALAQSRGGEKP